jgi:hypothetical protein
VTKGVVLCPMVAAILNVGQANFKMGHPKDYCDAVVYNIPFTSFCLACEESRGSRTIGMLILEVTTAVAASTFEC